MKTKHSLLVAVLATFIALLGIMGCYHDSPKTNVEEISTDTITQAVANQKLQTGIDFINTGKYADASTALFSALKMFEHLGDSNSIARTYNAIGVVYDNQGQEKNAMSYYLKSLSIRDEIFKRGPADSVLKDCRIGKAGTLNNIGTILDEQGNHTKAIDYYLEALNIAKEIGSEIKISMYYNNIGNSYRKMRDYENSLGYLEESLRIKQGIGDQSGVAAALLNIGVLLGEKGLFEEAIEKIEQSLLISNKIDNKEILRDSYSSLVQIYESKGNFKKALEYDRAYHELYVRLVNMESTRQRAEMEAKYETEKATEKIFSLNRENELQSEKITNQRLINYGVVSFLIIALLFSSIIFKQKRTVEKQKDELKEQKEVVEDQKKELTDSIHYAKRIQNAILPSMPAMQTALKDGFVLYKPKDIVAGDFYWMERYNGKVWFAAADCTGHGVPGAMVSVVCSNALSKALLEEKSDSTGILLDKTREIVVNHLAKSGEEIKDGMDVSVCAIDFEAMILEWSGANNPLWIIRSDGTSSELIEVKPDKQPIGNYAMQKPFSAHTINLKQGDTIYIFTDGYQDQFGGEKGKKYKAVQMKEMLLTIQDRPMDEQKVMIEKSFETWRGKLEQIDDVCVIGVRV